MERLDLVDQPTPAPTRKVTAASLGTALAAVLVGGAVWLFGVDQPPAGFEGGFGFVLAAVFGYFTRDRDTDATS